MKKMLVAVLCTFLLTLGLSANTTEKDLFRLEQNSKNSEGIENKVKPKKESLVITSMIAGKMSATIRPLIKGDVKRKVEAIGIDKGKVIAVGSEKAVLKEMNDRKITFTMKSLKEGQALLPGLIEPHVHILPTAFLGTWLNLSAFDGQEMRRDYDMNWIEEKITEYIKTNESGFKKEEWILGYNVDPALMPFKVNDGKLNELVNLDLDKLDAITSDYPILLLSASGHTLYLNSKALEIVYRKNKNNKSFFNTYPNLDIFKESTNGKLQETEQMNWADNAIPSHQKAKMKLGVPGYIKRIFKTASSRGITLMYDAGMDENSKKTIKFLINGNIRVGAAKICRSQSEIDSLEDYSKMKEYRDVYIGHIKLVSDGSNQGLTGYQSEDYCCFPPNNRGIFNFRTEPDGKSNDQKPLFQSMVDGAIKKGWSLMIHANGDEAVTQTIKVYKNSSKAGTIKKRHRIEHCSILDKEQIKEMNELGISPGFLIGHVGYWGNVFKKAIFEGKADKLDPCKSSLDGGLKISLHSDNFVSPLGPLRMMEQAITRVMEGSLDPDIKPKQENVLNPKECITAEEALKAVTYDAAWQCHADKWVGSLEEGKFADFVILEKDPINMKDVYMQMRNIPVIETWVGGAKIFECQ